MRDLPKMKKITRSIVVAMHKYTPFGGEFYEPILDFFLANMKKYENEYDKLYLLDSTWDIDPKKIEGMKAEIVKVDPNLRYYDAYKFVLPQIKEVLVLFLDNDMVIYREGIINSVFEKLEGEYDVVSIYDTIGERTYPELGGQSKFCPYLFATGTACLKDFLKVDWGSNMPESETLGRLTEAMLKDEIKPYEMEEDKSNCLYEGTQDEERGKDLGYYHIRSGSLPAYLLATKHYGDKETYSKYIKEQPKTEYIRQLAWYYRMPSLHEWSAEIIEDAGISIKEWGAYLGRFSKYHFYKK
jgi:hypothetical protein